MISSEANATTRIGSGWPVQRVSNGMRYRMPFETLCTGHPDPIRVVAFASEEIIHTLLPEVAALECSWTITRRGNYGSAELAIMNPSCSKASDVIELARY